MFRVNVNGKAYKVRFAYADDFLTERETYCSIEDEEGKMWNGFATCQPEDQFQKSIGRKLALKRALESGEFDKSIRTDFWDAYKASKCRV